MFSNSATCDEVLAKIGDGLAHVCGAVPVVDTSTGGDVPMRDAWMTPEQVQSFEHRPARKAGDDVVTEYEREVLGQYARLQIPLTHSRDMRRFADLLRGLANELDLLSRETVLSEFKILMRVKHECVGQMNLKMKELARPRGR